MNIKALIPSPIKPFLKKVYYQYALHSPFQGPVPPAYSVFIGNGDFVTVGNLLLDHFIKEGGLKPSHKVLDVGSGMGRAAYALTSYLDPKQGGSYNGFEIVKSGVDWCRNKFGRWPYFQFLHADVYNYHYNPEGRYKASEYSFPYSDASFDFIFLTSVFTHMMPEDLENYVSEISRVLKPGGTSFITYFILEPESIQLVKEGKVKENLAFKPVNEIYSVRELDDPEDAIAFHKTYLEDVYKKSGLTITQTLLGSWCYRKKTYSFQDVIIAKKSS